MTSVARGRRTIGERERKRPAVPVDRFGGLYEQRKWRAGLRDPRVPMPTLRELLLGGLHGREYRGYDRAGMSRLVDGRIESVRAVGPLRAGNALCVQPMEGCDGTPDGR